ncbi:RAC-alpha serine/threonine-protein kinase [Dinochytrium kinnereticum]|nr:RAC-alpha serine/threonine-protein kinase [Dinochytrium kinnereticum]
MTASDVSLATVEPSSLSIRHLCTSDVRPRHPLTQLEPADVAFFLFLVVSEAEGRNLLTRGGGVTLLPDAGGRCFLKEVEGDGAAAAGGLSRVVDGVETIRGDDEVADLMIVRETSRDDEGQAQVVPDDEDCVELETTAVDVVVPGGLALMADACERERASKGGCSDAGLEAVPVSSGSKEVDTSSDAVVAGDEIRSLAEQLHIVPTSESLNACESGCPCLADAPPPRLPSLREMVPWVFSPPATPATPFPSSNLLGMPVVMPFMKVENAVTATTITPLPPATGGTWIPATVKMEPMAVGSTQSLPPLEQPGAFSKVIEEYTHKVSFECVSAAPSLPLPPLPETPTPVLKTERAVSTAPPAPSPGQLTDSAIPDEVSSLNWTAVDSIECDRLFLELLESDVSVLLKTLNVDASVDDESDATVDVDMEDNRERVGGASSSNPSSPVTLPSASKKKEKTQKRAKSGYSLFLEAFKADKKSSIKKYGKGVKDAWSAMSDVDKKVFRDQARALKKASRQKRLASALRNKASALEPASDAHCSRMDNHPNSRIGLVACEHEGPGSIRPRSSFLSIKPKVADAPSSSEFSKSLLVCSLMSMMPILGLPHHSTGFLAEGSCPNTITIATPKISVTDASILSVASSEDSASERRRESNASGKDCPSPGMPMGFIDDDEVWNRAQKKAQATAIQDATESKKMFGRTRRPSTFAVQGFATTFEPVKFEISTLLNGKPPKTYGVKSSLSLSQESSRASRPGKARQGSSSGPSSSALDKIDLRKLSELITLLSSEGQLTAEEDVEAVLSILRVVEAEKMMSSDKLSCVLGVRSALEVDKIHTYESRRSIALQGRASASNSPTRLDPLYVTEDQHSEMRDVVGAMGRGSSATLTTMSSHSDGGMRVGELGKVFSPSSMDLKSMAIDEHTEFSLDSNVPEEEDLDENGGVKRSNKIASFFGVSDKQNEKQKIESMLSSKRFERRQKGSKPEFIARFYFANMTYISLNLSLEATATDAIRLLLERLHISDKEEEYAIYQYHQDSSSEKEIPTSNRLYDTMMTWSTTEVFLFKRKAEKRRNLLRSLKVGDTQSFLEATAALEKSDHSISESGKAGDPIPNTVRRVSKLAGFFGLQPDAQPRYAIKVRKKSKGTASGMDELLKLLNLVDLSGKKGERIEEERDSAENMFKEGILSLRVSQNGSSDTDLIPVWCVLDEGRLTLRSGIKSEGPDAPNNTLISISIVNAKVEIETAQEKSDSSGFAFNIAYASSDGSTHVIGLSARTLSELDEWMEVLGASGCGILRNAILSKEKEADSERESTSKPETATSNRKFLMNDFEVHRVLGRGKYGTVMLCSQRSTSKVYAVKVIDKTLAEGAAGVDMMLETQILQSIRHPFIVSLHAAFQSPTRLYLIMDYVNGGELFFHVANFGRFDEVRVRFYSAEIFLAVRGLHEQGIIYRDLKLENILLDRDGHVKIADFGLSRQDGTPEEDTEILGTLEYLAPEVLEGKGTSFASDWWALGIVMFEMLCASHPFHSENRMGIMRNILQADVSFPDFVSAPAQDILIHLLNRQPKMRLGSRRAGSDEIQHHAFFQSINFDALESLEVVPPYIPQVADDFDVQFFDETFTDAPIDGIDEDDAVERLHS